MISIYLKPGREKALLRHHPWVFSGAIDRMDGNPGMGETVKVFDANRKFLASGAFSPESQIRVRVWSWDPGVEIDENFFSNLLTKAINMRIAVNVVSLDDRISKADVYADLPSAIRLVNAESDGLPGLIVDRYKNTLVVQFLSAGAEYWRKSIIALMLELTAAEHIYERSDTEVRKLEGLPFRAGSLFGNSPEKIMIKENNLYFFVNLFKGHKTGFYLDQRVNRLMVRKLAMDKDVLDCFAYTGGFALNALKGGAKSITALDSSASALELARKNLQHNDLPEKKAQWLEVDVFHQLRKFRDQAREFDLIILDPPKFAPTASQVHRATRAYKDINLLALKLLRRDGFLVTFSCSGGVDPALFQKIVAGAALDADVNVQIVSNLTQSWDHPTSLNFPEGFYLKGLILRVM